jgi:cellulose synthase operon protein YhjQ
MGSRSTEMDGQPTADSTPEDVAALYSWANLQGAKYRDYSASRREYRAQVRYRAAKALLERELKAQLEAEAAAAEAERAALTAEATVHSQDSNDRQTSRIPSPRSAEAAKTKAAAERVEAARRAEAAAHAAVRALREEREIAEAHSSARRQTLVYAESELRRRQLAGPQPRGPLGEPYATSSTGPGDLRTDGPSNMEQVPASGWQDLVRAPAEASSVARNPLGGEGAFHPASDATVETVVGPAAAGGRSVEQDEVEQNAPAWLFASQMPSRPTVSQAISQAYKAETSGGDTLQDSRERVAARWFALKGVFEQSGPEFPALPPARPGEVRTPVLAVFSLAGGVGKTSLVATLGRALSAQGESVVLTDTTAHGLLPFYFGARELRAGVVRAFPPPADKAGQPISLVIYDAAASIAEELHQNVLAEEILRNGTGSHRLLLDLSSGSSWLVYRMVNLHPTVLVPITPDMNSVISLQAVERVFRGIVDSAGRPLLPYYLLNQFDAALPLHLDVREVFRRKLGDRLLPFAIRHSPAVSEALAAGMTVVDYAPSEAVAQDFLAVAAWLRTLSPPARDGLRGLRWGER